MSWVWVGSRLSRKARWQPEGDHVGDHMLIMWAVWVPGGLWFLFWVTWGSLQRVWDRKVTQPGLCLGKVAGRRTESWGMNHEGQGRSGG